MRGGLIVDSEARAARAERAPPTERAAKPRVARCDRREAAEWASGEAASREAPGRSFPEVLGVERDRSN